MIHHVYAGYRKLMELAETCKFFTGFSADNLINILN